VTTPARDRRPDGRRRRSLRVRLANFAILVSALIALGGVYTALAPSGHADVNTPGKAGDQVAAGHDLFSRGCSSCHGLNGEGSSQAPSLVGVGAAAVDFQVGTGRMPLARFGAMAERKEPRYSPAEISELAAYVASLGPGPAIPSNDLINGYTSADEAKGGEFFRTNCAQCHNAVGEGGALARGVSAPALNQSTPKQMYEAMLTGPEQMPIFPDTELTPSMKQAIIKYLVDVNHQGYDEGGHPLGRVGPITEGLVGILVGVGGCVAFTLWIGTRT
jgi:ubiquinol-cytochrome c reductase cytochrome c subunit